MHNIKNSLRMDENNKNGTEVLECYNSLKKEMHELGLLHYIPRSYYYDKIAFKFNISADRAYRLLSKQWRREERRVNNDKY